MIACSACLRWGRPGFPGRQAIVRPLDRERVRLAMAVATGDLRLARQEPVADRGDHARAQHPDL